MTLGHGMTQGEGSGGDMGVDGDTCNNRARRAARHRGGAFNKRGGIGGAWQHGQGILGQVQGGGAGAHEGGTEKSGGGLSGVVLNPRGTAKSYGWGSLGAEVNRTGGCISNRSELPQRRVQSG